MSSERGGTADCAAGFRDANIAGSRTDCLSQRSPRAEENTEECAGKRTGPAAEVMAGVAAVGMEDMAAGEGAAGKADRAAGDGVAGEACLSPQNQCIEERPGMAAAGMEDMAAGDGMAGETGRAAGEGTAGKADRAAGDGVDGRAAGETGIASGDGIAGRKRKITAKRVGILGGTFDPIHLGHIHIAEAAYAEYGLDELWFMPAGDPYFKEEKGYTDAGVRLEMTEACLRGIGHPGFCCSDCEINDTSATYTSETLKAIRNAHPSYELYFIMGYDSLKALDTWHLPGDILGSAVLLVAVRDEADAADIERLAEHFRSRYGCADIRAIHTPELNISSTMIRQMAAQGEDFTGLVTAATAEFIRERSLYGAG